MPTVSQHYNLTTGDVSALASDDSMRAAAPVVLMVSGGADSTALLLMACSSRLDIADGRGCAPSRGRGCTCYTLTITCAVRLLTATRCSFAIVRAFWPASVCGARFLRMP